MEHVPDMNFLFGNQIIRRRYSGEIELMPNRIKLPELLKLNEQGESIAKRLDRLLKENGLSIRAAAEVAGTAPSNISNWLAGSNPTDFDALKKLADTLGVSIGYILLGYDETPCKRELTVDDLYVREEIFEGLLEVQIRRLVPRKKDNK
ncbi:MAG: helix-turn-helix transcriptional regulator [Deltaproteobacteria bacterium]|nr:helix-turn-helix transcriptional regulator [Deltaproteobacteria bacterium]